MPNDNVKPIMHTASVKSVQRTDRLTVVRNTKAPPKANPPIMGTLNAMMVREGKDGRFGSSAI
jgi:hypothetical protein